MRPLDGIDVLESSQLAAQNRETEQPNRVKGLTTLYDVIQYLDVIVIPNNLKYTVPILVECALCMWSGD